MVSVALRPSVPQVDALIVGIRSSESLAEYDIPFDALGFSAQAGQTATVPSSPGANSTLTIYVGIADDADHEALRIAASRGIRAAGRAKSLAIDLGELDDEQLTAVTESVIYSSYRFDRYKSKPSDEDSEQADKKPTQLEKVSIISPRSRQAAAKAALARGITLGEAVTLARDWVNVPGRDLRPPEFASQIKSAVPKAVSVTVYDEKRLAKDGCGGILSVGQGSEAPPRIAKLEYKPAKSDTHLALVGKGITFDSGGLSIKTGVGMQTMKCDMAGAAAVVAAIKAIAELELPIKVTAFACLAENMPSGSATRPGDVVTMRNKKTVEILNTDAEGRMVLGDGLSLAAETKPDYIVDLATLTGAAMAALGTKTAAIFGNNNDFEQVVEQASATAGEATWRLPITEEITKQLTASNIADLRQIGTKSYGGALFAAAFLEAFVDDITWSHIDIAGPSFNDSGAYDYTPTGGTGYGVRTIVQIAEAVR